MASPPSLKIIRDAYFDVVLHHRRWGRRVVLAAEPCWLYACVCYKGREVMVKSVLLIGKGKYGMIGNALESQWECYVCVIVHPIGAEVEYVCRLCDASPESLFGIRGTQCTIVRYERTADMVDVLCVVAVREGTSQHHRIRRRAPAAGKNGIDAQRDSKSTCLRGVRVRWMSLAGL